MQHVYPRARPLSIALVKLLYAILLLAVILFGLAVSYPRGDYPGDFRSFIISGMAASEGHNPYGIYPLTPTFSLAGSEIHTINMNPPISVILFERISSLDTRSVLTDLHILSILLYLVTVGLLVLKGPRNELIKRTLWAMGLAGFWYNLAFGQIYVLLALFAAVAWLLTHHHRYVISALLIGTLVAFKPNFIIWIILVALTGHWMIALIASTWAAFLSLVPALVYGTNIYVQWFEAISDKEGKWSPLNGSLFGLTDKFDVPWLGILLSAFLLLAVAVLIFRRRPSTTTTANLALVSALLASPLAWPGYTIMLLPVFLSRRWTPCLTAASLLLLFPTPLIFMFSQSSHWHLVLFGSIYPLALILVLIQLIKDTLEQLPNVSPARIQSLTKGRGNLRNRVAILIRS